MIEHWVRQPALAAPLPALVCVPHYGTQPLPGTDINDYADPAYASFPYGYADAFAADLYDGLQACGATLLLYPWSRLFVDTNRQRDDFELVDGHVQSKRGVIRTHSIADAELFSTPLTAAQAEQRLAQFYDPYHRTLHRLLEQMHARHGYLLVLDAHTGSERRMGSEEIILGTRRGATIDSRLSELAAGICAAHGFRAEHDVPGYSGGFTVRHYAEPHERQIHALQFEVNSRLLIDGSRQDFMAAVRRHEVPPRNDANLARLQTCVADVIEQLSAALPGLDRG